ncbi:MAG: DUF720 domain-containing protein [Chlamydiales bacterium]
MTTPINSINPSQHALIGQRPQTADDSNNQENVKEFTLALIYTLLEETVQTGNSSANIDAKELSGNGALQHQLANREARQANDAIPGLNVHHHAARNVTEWAGRACVHKHYSAYTTYTGQTAQAAARADNLWVGGERSIMSDNMMTLQNQANMGETNVEVKTNSITVTVREAAGILQKVLVLTMNALQRKDTN